MTECGLPEEGIRILSCGSESLAGTVGFACTQKETSYALSQSQSPTVINGEENADENEVKCPDWFLPGSAVVGAAP